MRTRAHARPIMTCVTKKEDGWRQELEITPRQTSSCKWFSCRWQIRARQLEKVTWDMSQSFLPASDGLTGCGDIDKSRQEDDDALLCLRRDTIIVPSRRARQRNLWSNAARYKCKSYKSPRWWLKDITVTSQPIIKQTGTIRDKRGHTLNNEPLRARTFSPRWNIRVIFH